MQNSGHLDLIPGDDGCLIGRSAFNVMFTNGASRGAFLGLDMGNTVRPSGLIYKPMGVRVMKPILYDCRRRANQTEEGRRRLASRMRTRWDIDSGASLLDVSMTTF